MKRYLAPALLAGSVYSETGGEEEEKKSEPIKTAWGWKAKPTDVNKVDGEGSYWTAPAEGGDPIFYWSSKFTTSGLTNVQLKHGNWFWYVISLQRSATM